MRLKPFFRTESRQTALASSAALWVGTPFFPNNAALGAGVGCVDLVHELWVSVGAIPRLNLPRYELDHGHHLANSQLLHFLLSEVHLAGRLIFVAETEPSMPGDLLALRSGHVDHHLACALPFEKVIHSHSKFGVQILGRSERQLVDRLLYRLRLVEEVSA